MNKKYKIGFIVLLFLALVALAGWYLQRTGVAVLSPAGPVARQERQLIIITVLLSLVVVVPVFIMLGAFAWKYREGNASARYTPEWDHSRLAETIWWLVPSALILILGVIIWDSSHTLDPFRPLASSTPPLTIQVVALDWKWLFIYPEQHIASVNFFQIPRDTPVAFQITADAPMNSFWIPRLGGQIYAMPGMATQLHLMATQDGNFYGSSANISGDGFADMRFVAKAGTTAEFDHWVNTVRQSPRDLSPDIYNGLAMPSTNSSVTYYTASNSGLFNSIINKYMVPGVNAQTPSMPAMPNMPAMSGMSGMQMQ
jgi:cytochrome o ubiquinol oxidase subunit 2